MNPRIMMVRRSFAYAQDDTTFDSFALNLRILLHNRGVFYTPFKGMLVWQENSKKSEKIVAQGKLICYNKQNNGIEWKKYTQCKEIEE